MFTANVLSVERSSGYWINFPYPYIIKACNRSSITTINAVECYLYLTVFCIHKLFSKLFSICLKHCPANSLLFIFQTDLKNTDYTLEAGAKRNFEAAKLAEEMEERSRKEKEEEELNNPMKVYFFMSFAELTMIVLLVYFNSLTLFAKR